MLITLNEHHLNVQVPIFLLPCARMGPLAHCCLGAALLALLLRAVIISHSPN